MEQFCRHTEISSIPKIGQGHLFVSDGIATGPTKPFSVTDEAALKQGRSSLPSIKQQGSDGVGDR
jgi:hypothetical protein